MLSKMLRYVLGVRDQEADTPAARALPSARLSKKRTDIERKY